jgi:hypothetical protein
MPSNDSVEDATGVLDTSVVVNAAAKRIDLTRLPVTGLVTTVTLGELAAGPLTATAERERASRQAVLDEALVRFSGRALPFDEPAAAVFGHVFSEVLRSGRQPRRHIADLMIAAIARSRGLAVYTTNPADFAGIDDLHVVGLALR